jgi:hypothetical protein
MKGLIRLLPYRFEILKTLILKTFVLFMKIMKHIFGLFLGIMCLNQIVYGQTDSLNKVVSILKKQPESTKRDTLLVKTLNDYAKEIMATENHILGLPYAQEAEKLAIKTHWDKGLLLSYKTISTL